MPTVPRLAMHGATSMFMCVARAHHHHWRTTTTATTHKVIARRVYRVGLSALLHARANTSRVTRRLACRHARRGCCAPVPRV